MKMLESLQLMFTGGRRNDPHLFEHVVCEDVKKQKLKYLKLESGKYLKLESGLTDYT